MIKKMQQYSYEKKRMVAIFTALLCVAVYALLILVYMRFNSVGEALRGGSMNSNTANAAAQSINPLSMISEAFTNVFTQTVPRDGAVNTTDMENESKGLQYVPDEDAPSMQ